MMPIDVRDQPIDSDFTQGLERARTNASKWKSFRQSDYGQMAMTYLQAVYGDRCLYCDHAHSRTIDHVSAKSHAPTKIFNWRNWRPVCLDCNHAKNDEKTVDPGSTDPSDYFSFNLATGEPVVTATKKADKAIARKTCQKLLDNATLNEARRTLRAKLVQELKSLAAGRSSNVDELIGPRTPHRAIARELFLETDPTLNPWLTQLALSARARAKFRKWANDPR